MADDVLQLDPGIGRIDADRDRADHLDAEIGVKPFRRILAGDGDAVAGLEAERRAGRARRSARSRNNGSRNSGFQMPYSFSRSASLSPCSCGALAEQLRNGDRGVLQRGPQRRGVGCGRRFAPNSTGIGGCAVRRLSSVDIRCPPVLRLPRGGRRDRPRSRPDRAALRRACLRRSCGRNSAHERGRRYPSRSASRARSSAR